MHKRNGIRRMMKNSENVEHLRCNICPDIFLHFRLLVHTYIRTLTLLLNDSKEKQVKKSEPEK